MPLDLKQSQAIDLHPVNSTDGFAEWLGLDPEVEVITRDRSSLYADGGRQGGLPPFKLPTVSTGRPAGEPPMLQRREEQRVRLRSEHRRGDPLIEILLQIVMAWQLRHLTAFFVEAHPAEALLNVIILDLHGNGRANAREGVAHKYNQCAIAQAEQRVGLDGIEQLAHLFGGEDGGFALLDAVLRAAHGVSVIGCDDLCKPSDGTVCIKE
jgi:hypothetical protein